MRLIQNLSKATGIYAKTMPFVVLRFAIGVLLGILSVLYFGAIGYVLWTTVELGTVSWSIAAGGLVVALVLFYVLWRWFARYVLYLIKAGHIAVIAHIVDSGEVPSNQLQFGIGKVKDQFVETSVLFGVDVLVKAVLTQFNGAVVSISNLAGFVPGLQQAIRFVGRAIRLAASYIDEAIIAYMFLNPDENHWKSATDGVVLYAKTWKPVLATTMIIVAGMYAATVAMFFALTPVAAVLSDLSLAFELFGWVVAAALGLTIYSGLLKPWVKTVVITTFLIESADEIPDAATRRTIEARSTKFRELQEKAKEGEPGSTMDVGADAPSLA